MPLDPGGTHFAPRSGAFSRMHKMLLFQRPTLTILAVLMTMPQSPFPPVVTIGLLQ
jgi:hypothetical protein